MQQRPCLTSMKTTVAVANLAKGQANAAQVECLVITLFVSNVLSSCYSILHNLLERDYQLLEVKA